MKHLKVISKESNIIISNQNLKIVKIKKQKSTTVLVK